MTRTTFSQREWYGKDVRFNKKYSSVKDSLEKACWNGSLDEMLPGIVAKSTKGKRLPLWQITRFNSFLGLELCESMTGIYEVQSINPYLFAPKLSLN